MSNISRPIPSTQQFHPNPYTTDPQFQPATGYQSDFQQGLQQPGPLPHTVVQNPNTVPTHLVGTKAGIPFVGHNSTTSVPIAPLPVPNTAAAPPVDSTAFPHSNMSRDAIPQNTAYTNEPVRDRTMGEKLDSATHTLHHTMAKDGGGNVELLKQQNEEKRELDKAHHRALHGRGVKEAGGIGDLVGQVGDKFSEGGQKIKHKIQEARTKMGNKEVVCDQHGNAMPVDKDKTPVDSTGMPPLEKQQGFQGGDPHLLEKQRMAGQFGGAPLDANRARG